MNEIVKINFTAGDAVVPCDLRIKYKDGKLVFEADAYGLDGRRGTYADQDLGKVAWFMTSYIGEAYRAQGVTANAREINQLIGEQIEGYVIGSLNKLTSGKEISLNVDLF